MAGKRNQSTSAELINAISGMRTVLESQVSLIGTVLAALVDAPGYDKTEKEVEPKVATTVGMISQTAGSSCQTVTKFRQPGYETRDCFIIARSIVESMINCCFILAEGPKAASKAIRHARQKAFRDLSRDSKIATSRIKLSSLNVPQAEEILGLEEDLKEFSHRSGLENRNWTTKSVDERIRIAGEKFGSEVLTNLHIARFSIYRHSSEIIHGSFFGSAFWAGFLSPNSTPKSDEDFSKIVGEWHWLLLFGTILSVHAFLVAFDSKYGLERVSEQANVLLESVKENPYYLEIASESRHKGRS